MDNQYKEFKIPTYVINLKRREERLKHILSQYDGKPEFDIKVVEACEHEIGAIGLWQSMTKIINMAIQNDDDVIIICEDDHEFTPSYSSNYLLSNIIEAHQQGCAILSGGIGHFGQAVPLTINRIWVNPFQSTQFIVLYKKIYPTILSYVFKNDDVADLVLASMTSHKMVLCPFISYQKNFGYSDITGAHNEQPDLVQIMFKRTEERLRKIQLTSTKYNKL